MIPYEAALVFWIALSFVFMIDKDNARGFSLAYVLALLVLPAGLKVNLPGIPDLDKYNVAGIGVFLGTILFHPHVFDRFKFSWLDLLLVAVALVHFVTSVSTGVGVYDGISQANTFLLSFVLPVFLARLHIGTPQGLRTFLLVLVFASVVYAPLALWEFRMSPQLHRVLYGYFQHQFAQHMRGGFYRPIVCFSHALALGRFFAVAAFLAAFPLRKDLERMLPSIGGFLFLAPLFALLLSMSYSPYLLFAMLCGGYLAIQRGFLWLVYVVPAIAFLWLGSVIAGYTPGYGVVDAIHAINPDRAESLEYRLDALQEYRTVILSKPAFGWGGWGQGRIEGRATDSQALISMLMRGLVGTCFFYAWWFFMLHRAVITMQQTRGSVFQQRVAGLVVLFSLALAISVVDAAQDTHVELLAGAFYPLYYVRLDRPKPQPFPARHFAQSPETAT